MAGRARDGKAALVAGRATIGGALALDPPKPALRVLLVVIEHTALWGKLDDHISHARIRDLTGMCQRDITRGFAWLAEHELIDYRPGVAVKGGTRVSSYVRLTMDRHGPQSEQPTMDRGGHRPWTVATPTMDRHSPPSGVLPGEIPDAGAREPDDNTEPADPERAAELLANARAALKRGVA